MNKEIFYGYVTVRQIRYFSNRYSWFTEDMLELSERGVHQMFQETESGQMLWPFYNKHEDRDDIRFKLLYEWGKNEYENSNTRKT
jgi:hypothetical protein